MEWKDSGEKKDQARDTQEEYFDEEEYSPWANGKGQEKNSRLKKIPALFILLSLAIVAMVAVLLMLLIDGDGDAVAQQKLDAMEDRLLALEERLDKYEAIDEKVTRIWEQAKSFEKFKDRFDRSEASMSLRMDHLTMSLETMQKQVNASQKKVSTKQSKTSKKEVVPAAKRSAKNKIHRVKPGETLYSISKQYGIKVQDLIKLNPMPAGSVIAIGQELVVPKTSN